MNNNIKLLGQVFTPENIVIDMLNLIDYKGKKILKKHIIDNSCGDGAFLKIIVEKYINEYKKEYGNLTGIEQHLETYIHGIEIDQATYKICLENLNTLIFLRGLSAINWDILNADAIECSDFENKMDYVVGNPPYVRVHNLGENFNKIRKYKICKEGMTDLYILFYEIGFNMLKPTGTLCYITPNSFYSSRAGLAFRKFIMQNKNLSLVADLGHYKPFKVSAYTTICKFKKNISSETFDYYKYNMDGKYIFQECLNTSTCFINNKLILATNEQLKLFKDIQNYIPKNKTLLDVKNGFATLADKVFISQKETSDSIKILKASTGKWSNCIFPYDSKGNIVNFHSLSKDTQKHLNENKEKLTKISLEKNSKWYSFGRSQAIKDVFKNKIAINTTIKDLKSIKINKIKSGEGVYSGLYIIGNITIEQVIEYVMNNDFIQYLSILNKCKNGGYYTLSSIDLKKYLIFKMENTNEQQSVYWFN